MLRGFFRYSEETFFFAPKYFITKIVKHTKTSFKWQKIQDALTFPTGTFSSKRRCNDVYTILRERKNEPQRKFPSKMPYRFDKDNRPKSPSRTVREQSPPGVGAGGGRMP